MSTNKWTAATGTKATSLVLFVAWCFAVLRSTLFALARSNWSFANGRCARFPAIGHILRATSQDRYKLSRCCARAARQLKASPHFFLGEAFFSGPLPLDSRLARLTHRLIEIIIDAEVFVLPLEGLLEA